LKHVFIVTVHIRLKLCKAKGKVAPVHVMKADGTLNVQLHTFVTSDSWRSAVSPKP